MANIDKQNAAEKGGGVWNFVLIIMVFIIMLFGSIYLEGGSLCQLVGNIAAMAKGL